MKKKILDLFLVLCITITLTAIPSQVFAVSPPYQEELETRAYYCDPINGSMDNPGTLEAPWSTLEDVFAAGKTFAPGDIIYLMSGDHGSPVITQKNSGYVTITKYGDDKPVINGIEFDGASYWILDNVEIYTTAAPPAEPVLEHPVYPLIENTLVRVKNSSYITFSNCYIYSIEDSSLWTADDWNYKAWNGIRVYEKSQNVTIDRCYFKNLNFPISLSSDYNTVKYCTIENFCGDGIRIDGNYLTVEYNVIKDSYKTNGNHCDMIQGYNPNGLKGSVIRGNILINITSANRPFYSNAQGIGLFDGWYDDFVIENNLVVVHHWHGISVYGGRNCRIVNNTVVKNPIGSSSSTPWIGFFNKKDGTPGSGCIMRNNLTPRIQSTVGCTTSNNIIITDYTSHFVDYYGFDFHLKAGSTAINAGTTADAPTIDLEGNVRLEPYDVGCYEYYSLEQLEEFIRYGALQEAITNHGILNSLLVKVENAQIFADKNESENIFNQLNALKNEVIAQSGKHIAAGFAELLIENILILMNKIKQL